MPPEHLPHRSKAIGLRWRKSIRKIALALEQQYSSPRHGNPRNPVNDLFYILLTQKTSIPKAERAYRSIRRRYKTWDILAEECRLGELKRILRPLGLWRKRSAQIIGIARRLRGDFGRVTLAPMRRLSIAETKRYLLGLPGIGEKSARCVLMYGFGADTSPMDANATRVLRRLGLLGLEIKSEKAHAIVDQHVPHGMAYTLHVNLVAHGQRVCRPIHPLCNECRLASICEHPGLAKRNLATTSLSSGA